MLTSFSPAKKMLRPHNSNTWMTMVWFTIHRSFRRQEPKKLGGSMVGGCLTDVGWFPPAPMVGIRGE